MISESCFTPVIKFCCFFLPDCPRSFFQCFPCWEEDSFKIPKKCFFRSNAEFGMTPSFCGWCRYSQIKSGRVWRRLPERGPSLCRSRRATSAGHYGPSPWSRPLVGTPTHPALVAWSRTSLAQDTATDRKFIKHVSKFSGCFRNSYFTTVVLHIEKIYTQKFLIPEQFLEV